MRCCSRCMAGIAVAEAVEQTTGLHPDLRWPNDVLLNGKKFCGILTEMNAEPRAFAMSSSASAST